MNHEYDDIIHLNRPISKKHRPMSMLNRAAQFSPFAALSGYEELIEESGRLVDRKIELDEYEQAELDRKLQVLKQNPQPVDVFYFLPDGVKKGGRYEQYHGRFLKADEYEDILIFADKTRIAVKDILRIEFSEE